MITEFNSVKIISNLKRRKLELYEDVDVNFDNLLIAYQSKSSKLLLQRILGRSF